MVHAGKRIKIILLAAVVMAVVGIISAQAAYADDSGKLFVKGEDITKAEGQTVKGDNNEGTAKLTYDKNGDPVLTLENYKCTYHNYPFWGNFAAISYKGSSQLTMNLKGENSVIADGEYAQNGIFSEGPLVIRGNGKLTVSGAIAEQSYGFTYSTGITCRTTLTIDSGTVIASGRDINKSSNDCRSCGIMQESKNGNVTINGGTVIASGGKCVYDDSSNISAGIMSGGDVIVNGGTVKANGGSVKENSGSYGLKGNRVFVSKNIAGVEASGNSRAVNGLLKNNKAGEGWDDTSGSSGHCDINIVQNDNNWDLQQKKILFTGFDPADISSVTLTAVNKSIKGENDGTSYDLLTADGSAAGGTLNYALGDEYGPTEQYKASIPRGEKASSYYVWVKAAGDDSHRDSDPVCKAARLYIPVTFKVKGGAWNGDKTTADKTVELSRAVDEDKALVLAAEDIPAAGNVPSKDYKKGGSWDKDPFVYVNSMMVTKTLTFTFTYPKKAAGKMTAEGKTVKIRSKARKLRKTKKISAKKAYKISKNAGKLQYSKIKANKSSGKFRVNPKTGKITVKKGLKRGKYKLTVKVSDPGNAQYASVNRTVIVKIRISK